MCGIVGIAYKEISRQCDKSTIVKMRDAMVYRGPDDKGLYIKENIGLGHRRLSIIDLSTGYQPMRNEDGTVWIVCNGEIYNYKELRINLEKKGHKFGSDSDTEVILHLWEDLEEECVRQLNGMFGFALFDEIKKTVFIARDRLGIKPIYYTETNSMFAFSSEIKSLLKCSDVRAECNRDAVMEYLVFRHVSGDETLFSNIKSLEPGTTLTIKDGILKKNTYWTAVPDYKETVNMTYEEAEEGIESLIDESVGLQLMSDVPLGTFCSGGVDSSLITAIASKKMDREVNTFSVGFHEESYDETEFAKIVADKYQTNHHTIKLSSSDFAELLPGMIWHNDEPLNFANSIQIYAVSKLAKEFVTVVLTGEGADELFGGYPRYNIPTILNFLNKFRVISKPGLLLLSKMTLDGRIQKLVKSMGLSKEDLILFNSAVVHPDYRKWLDLIQDEKRLGVRTKAIRDIAGKGFDTVPSLLLMDQKNYLISILNRQDKMSMAASIESRVPYLDHRLVEFANSLPVKYKIKYFRNKYILKNIARKYLPENIINRRKSGFGVPLAQWFKSNEMFQDMLQDMPKDGFLTEFIDKKILSDSIESHLNSSKDCSEILWSAMNLSIWGKQFNVV